MTVAHDTPGPCPVCGGLTVAPAVQRSTLLAVSNVLVLKALDKLGNYLIRRGERSLYSRFGSIPRSEVYLHVRPTTVQVDRALQGAWDVIPAQLADFGCSGVTARQVQAMLTDYIHHLADAGLRHDVDLLRRCFVDQLGLPIYDTEPARA